MATDIFEMLVDILKISPQQVSQYASEGPLYQLFYLFIFPTVFLIVFIYILSYRIMKQHKGLRIVIAAIIYAFIVLQGFYTWFVTLSKFWLFGMIFLGFFFLLLGRGGDGGGGGGGGKRLARSSLDQLKTALIGERSLNPLQVGADQKVYEQEIENIGQQIKAKRLVMKEVPREQQNIVGAEIAQLEAYKRDLEDRKRRFLRMKQGS